MLPRSRHCGGHAEGQRPLRQHCVLGHQPQSRAAHPGGVCRRRVLAGVEEQHQGRSQLRAAGRRGGRTIGLSPIPFTNAPVACVQTMLEVDAGSWMCWKDENVARHLSAGVAKTMTDSAMCCHHVGRANRAAGGVDAAEHCAIPCRLQHCGTRCRNVWSRGRHCQSANADVSAKIEHASCHAHAARLPASWHQQQQQLSRLRFLRS